MTPERGLNWWQFEEDFDIIVESKDLVDQPLKTQLEYRIIAINKSGEGAPSNTIMAVL